MGILYRNGARFATHSKVKKEEAFWTHEPETETGVEFFDLTVLETQSGIEDAFDRGEVNTAFILQTNAPVLLNNGALGLEFDIRRNKAGNPDPFDEGGEVNWYHAMLKIGDRYWNGEQWTSQEGATFKFRTMGSEEAFVKGEEQDVKNIGHAQNSRLYMLPPEGQRGCYIPVGKNTYLFGKITLKIFNYYPSTRSTSVFDCHLLCTKCDLKWTPILPDVVAEDAYTYIRDLKNGSENKEVNLDLATQTSNAFGNNHIFEPQANGEIHYLKELVEKGNAYICGRPEEMLADRMAAVYGTPRHIIRVNVKLDKYATLSYGQPLTYDNARWAILAMEKKYADNKLCLTLIRTHP